MKVELSPEMRAKTRSNIMVVAAGMVMLGILIYLNNIISGVNALMGTITPFLIGIALAFLQLPIVRVMENMLSKTLFRNGRHPKLMRAISTTIALIAVLALMAGFLGILLPQMITSIKSLIGLAENFVASNAGSLDELLGKLEFLNFEGPKIVIEWQKLLETLTNNLETVMDSVLVVTTAIYQPVFQIFIGLITAFYLLMGKEHL